MKNKFFTLYSYCRTIEGRDFSIVLDLQRTRYIKIPPFLREILFEYLDLPVSEIVDLYKDDQGHILSYLEHLENDKFGFFTDNPEQYPPINLTWRSPGVLNNAILEISDLVEYDYADIISQLEDLNCYHFEIWLHPGFELNALQGVLEKFNESLVKSFDMVIPFDEARPMEDLIRFKEKCHKVNFILIYDSPAHYVDKRNLIIQKQDSLEEMTAKFDRPSEELCINLKFFIESLHFNPFYNQKIAIDKSGFIHNSMMTRPSYGNVKDNKIKDAVSSRSFQELWHASNDKIEELKDSALRYSMMSMEPIEKTDNGYRLKNK